MRIGELARQSGLSVDTLRFYEKIGLIRPPARDGAGRRDYDADVLVWVSFLGQLNATGMRQADRVTYARLRHQGDATIAARRQMLEAHREGLSDRIAALQRAMTLLDDKIANYRRQEAALTGKDYSDEP